MTVVLVAGALANKAHNAGEAWVRLSWVLGLRRLGLDAWLVEQIEPRTCVDAQGRPAPLEQSENLAWFDAVVERFGLRERAVLVQPDGTPVGHGDAHALRDAAAVADLLINISGNLTVPGLLQSPRRRVYVDLDPGYTQLWHLGGALGGALERHDHHLTVGLAVGRRGCAIPTGGLEWRAVLPPVLLDEWRHIGDDAPAPRFTTVASWRGGYGRLEHDGRLYGQKAHEFRRFAGLPRRLAATLEAALDIHPDDEADVKLLQTNGWRLADPRAVAGDPDAFRRYVQGSCGELSPAQGVYVETRSGWFGDRTTAYLASGRPAIVQDTGFGPQLPHGEGLLAFANLEEAARAVKTVLADYPKHARAARRLAEEHLDSDRVLGALLEDLLP